jgi:5-methylcytosine-specific restriction endonuclease McrA
MTGKRRHPFYNRKWQGARADYLARHPLCVMCVAAGRVTPATVVDHVKPHKGDATLFWDQSNWQSLCQHHHNSTKQSQDQSKYNHSNTCDADGYPLNNTW